MSKLLAMIFAAMFSLGSGSILAADNEKKDDKKEAKKDNKKEEKRGPAGWPVDGPKK